MPVAPSNFKFVICTVIYWIVSLRVTVSNIAQSEIEKRSKEFHFPISALSPLGIGWNPFSNLSFSPVLSFGQFEAMWRIVSELVSTTGAKRFFPQVHRLALSLRANAVQAFPFILRWQCKAHSTLDFASKFTMSAKKSVVTYVSMKRTDWYPGLCSNKNSNTMTANSLRLQGHITLLQNGFFVLWTLSIFISWYNLKYPFFFVHYSFTFYDKIGRKEAALVKMKSLSMNNWDSINSYPRLFRPFQLKTTRCLFTHTPTTHRLTQTSHCHLQSRPSISTYWHQHGNSHARQGQLPCVLI